MLELDAVQVALRDFGFDGWLLYDFRGANLLARRILQLDDLAMGTRRCFYCIPASAPPRKLVHHIESEVLDHLPGEKTVYLRWGELEEGVRELVAGMQTVAMEYSPRNANPYVSRVDAGTVELVRSYGANVASSGDLVQQFEAAWDDQQWRLHREASAHTDSAFDMSWRLIADRVRSQGGVEETEVRDAIMHHFEAHDLTTHHPPIVARGSHSGLPHYETGTGDDTRIREGDFVLIDLWAKRDHPRGVYSDLTRTGFVGRTVPPRCDEIFQIVAAARDAAIQCVRDAMAQRRVLHGWQVDDAARGVIERAGYGQYFTHRTGHSIGQETHGNGANMDNLETHEERRVLPRTCFSIEPGIYLPEFGVRSEVDVFVDADSVVHVTGGDLQKEVLPILEAY